MLSLSLSTLVFKQDEPVVNFTHVSIKTIRTRPWMARRIGSHNAHPINMRYTLGCNNIYESVLGHIILIDLHIVSKIIHRQLRVTSARARRSTIYSFYFSWCRREKSCDLAFRVTFSATWQRTSTHTHTHTSCWYITYGVRSRRGETLTFSLSERAALFFTSSCTSSKEIIITVMASATAGESHLRNPSLNRCCLYMLSRSGIHWLNSRLYASCVYACVKIHPFQRERKAPKFIYECEWSIDLYNICTRAWNTFSCTHEAFIPLLILISSLMSDTQAGRLPLRRATRSTRLYTQRG